MPFCITPPPPVTLACAVSPSSLIFPGDPVTVTATASVLNPKLKATYTWSGNGITGNGPTASIATAGLKPGSYTVKAEVSEGAKNTRGLSAGCTASFTVRDYDPPTISCMASPIEIQIVDTSTITATVVSPQNRLPLTFSYSASSGSVSGRGNSALYTPSGAGDATITCSVADKDGKTASSTTTVTAAVPHVAPVKPVDDIRLENTLAFHSIFFPAGQPRTTTPYIGLVPSQQTALAEFAADFKSYLKFSPGAKLILSGHTDATETEDDGMALSERRANSAKSLLVASGVPAESIETRGFGKEQQLNTAQVTALLAQNPDLSADDLKRILKQLPIIVLAQNRRVDITLVVSGRALEQSIPQYPFRDAKTLLKEEATTEPEQDTEALPSHVACNIYAVFGYPDIDMGQEGILPHYFRLIVGAFVPGTGIDTTQIASNLCKEETAPLNCISGTNWVGVSGGCGYQGQQGFTIAKDRIKYNYRVWTTTGNLAGGICADIVPPTHWIDLSGTSSQRCQQLSPDGTFTWQWGSKVTNADHKVGDGSTDELKLTISSPNDTIQTISSDHSDPPLTLMPIPVSSLVALWKWAKKGLFDNLPAVIFGSGGVLTGLILWLIHKMREAAKKKEQLAVQAQPAPPPQPQINIFIAPQHIDQRPEPGFREPPPPRHENRRPKGH